MDTPPAPKLTGHNYGGIEEYDNPMPGWWSWLFAGTVVFSAIYLFFVTLIGPAAGPLGAYEEELTEDARRQFAAMGEVRSDPASLLAMSRDDRVARVGRSIYLTNCAACHGPAGAGLSGPNLTDDHYVHVRNTSDVLDVIAKGRNFGAMPAWGNRLQPREVAVVASYVMSLREPRPGREPQGEVIPPWSDK